MAPSGYNRRRDNPRGKPTRTLTFGQIKQIETPFQELKQEIAQWKSEAGRWEAAAAEAQANAVEWETKARELLTAATNAQEKLAKLEAEASQRENSDSAFEASLTEKEQALQAAEERASKAENRLALEQAEYQNLKQRLERRIADQAAQEKMQLMDGLLPVLDNLDRAIAHAPPLDAEHKAFQEGVEMTRHSFLLILTKYGVHPIDAAEKPFDPEYHEAVGTINDPAYRPGTVVKVEQKGYTYQDKLLWPARVLITPIG